METDQGTLVAVLVAQLQDGEEPRVWSEEVDESTNEPVHNDTNTVNNIHLKSSLEALLKQNK